MTIAVLWYRKAFDQLWCLADTRISSGQATASDAGPKVLSIPYKVHRQVPSGNWEVERQGTWGFVFAGSTLTALSAHAITTAASQALARNNADAAALTLEDFAEILRAAAQYSISDAASRAASAEVGFRQYQFISFLFGYCDVSGRYRAFVVEPKIANGKFSAAKGELQIEEGRYFPIGSGTDLLDALMSAQQPSRQGVMYAMADLFSSHQTLDVGGNLQVGVASKTGFEVVPAMNVAEGGAIVSILGLDVDGGFVPSGYRVGHHVISLDRL